jgi:phosphohistidine phosphatase
MKKIIIVRHAKSDWENGLTDLERPLNDRGRRVAPKMGLSLNEVGGIPDYVICSPAKRTTQTASLLLHNLFNLEKIDYQSSVYEASFFELLNLINNDVDDEVDTLMLIGHNPGVTELVDYLSAANIGWLPTCSCVCLISAVNSWKEVSKETFSIDWNIYPKMFDH